MEKRLLPIAGGAILLVTVLAWAVPHFTAGPEIEVAKGSKNYLVRNEQPAAGLCPWREPEADRKQFFPDSTDSQDETLVLSGRRLEVEKRLGRLPTGEESALLIHRILRGQTPVGAIITRRARGESGVIEFVLALEPNGRVLGAKLQRLREPAGTAKALESGAWLGAFRGKSGADAWQPGKDIPDVPAEARSSAAAVLSEARTALILFEVAKPSAGAQPHH